VVVYTPVIPNSQLIVTIDNDVLNIQLLINPSYNLPGVMLVFFIVFVILSATTITLHATEIKQNKKDKKQEFIIIG
jgi:hypothetical protein